MQSQGLTGATTYITYQFFFPEIPRISGVPTYRTNQSKQIKGVRGARKRELGSLSLQVGKPVAGCDSFSTRSLVFPFLFLAEHVFRRSWILPRGRENRRGAEGYTDQRRTRRRGRYCRTILLLLTQFVADHSTLPPPPSLFNCIYIYLRVLMPLYHILTSCARLSIYVASLSLLVDEHFYIVIIATCFYTRTHYVDQTTRIYFLWLQNIILSTISFYRFLNLDIKIWDGRKISWFILWYRSWGQV